jgi:hypothetical protein
MTQNLFTPNGHFSVGAPLPVSFPYQHAGSVLVYGITSPSPTLLVAIDQPTERELHSLSSSGEKQYGITTHGPLSFLVSRFSLNGETIFSMDSPFHAGVARNANQEFIDSLVENHLNIESSQNSGLMTLQVVFDLNSKIVLGIRGFALPHRTSKVLLQRAIKQVCEPIERDEYLRLLQEAYNRYPTWNSMRKNAIVWDKGGRHV